VVSGNFLTARPVGIVEGVDFGHSGLVRKVDATAIRRSMDTGAVVLLSPFGFSPTGEAFNLTMEDVATSTAIALQADKLLFLTEYVHDGIGTMVVDEKLEELREATADDVGGILQLIEPFERDGTLVKRDRTEIERDIDHYTIIDHDGVIFACAALYPYPEARTAEMAALTVSPQSQGQGDGEKVLKRIEQRARAMGLKSIFVLTTRTMHWFIKRGFVQVDPDWLPEARKRKYNWDRKSQVLVKKL